MQSGEGPQNGHSGDIGQRIKRSASEAMQRTKTAANEEVRKGAQYVAGSASSAANAIRRVADEMEGDNSWMSSTLRRAADGIESATHNLQTGDISRVMNDVDAFARRQPALFVGASLLAGFALARLAKTAVEQERMRDDGVYDEPVQAM